MRQAIEWFQGWSIATKQFVFLFLVTAVLFFSLATLNLREAEGLYRDQVIHDSEVLLTRTADLIESYLDNVNNVLLMLSSNQELFAEGSEAQSVQTLRNYAKSNSSLIGALYLIRSDGKVYSNQQAFYDIMGHPHLQQLTELARANTSLISVSGLYNSPLAGPTVAYTKAIVNERNEYLGAAVLEINLNLLYTRIAPLLINSHQTFVMLTKTGQPVYLPGTQDDMLLFQRAVYPPQLTAEFMTRVSDLPFGVSHIQGAKDQLVTLKSAYNRLGWSVVLFIEESYFYQAAQKLHKNFSSAGVIWLLALLFCTYMMSRYFTSPIRTLVQKMDHLRDFSTTFALSTARKDEIGRLYSSYKALINRIHFLIKEVKEIEERKKETELKMLQSQIAPHFIYNTLACVSSLAKLNKQQEVVQTIKSLVGLLSFSFDRISSVVRLKDELEMLRMYVQIQNVRSGDKIGYIEQCDPEIMSSPILKLTLQPIVENAIFHGLARRKSAGVVTLRAFMRGDRVNIYIHDNGMGMSPETVRRLLQETPSQRVASRFTSIGLKNVNERIQLHYGERYGLKIRSTPEIGTTVRISIPQRAEIS
ncbi:cache domain-containing sensor histidine kinase [Paenibacillus thalictri]|uniref:histidine kinase n=1 Tax=Paenibacillus thalictri TaxID=2527873 RepID=A0A4V2J517_9BACL|nr:sensor histidine kinase [Paenibacillus thalictri]TBL81982.1 sensor histidine kinase [Paenibacillus thalictri]